MEYLIISVLKQLCFLTTAPFGCTVSIAYNIISYNFNEGRWSQGSQCCHIGVTTLFNFATTLLINIITSNVICDTDCNEIH